MSKVVLDDHLLRDLLAGEVGGDLAHVLADHEPATTNLYLLRLCRSVVSARGGALTGTWPSEWRRALGARLLELPDSIEVLPMQVLAFRMAEVVEQHRVSSLGAEAVAAAEHLSAELCVWRGDDGPRIRAATAALGAGYRAVDRGTSTPGR